MADTVRDVMTKDPATLDVEASALDAARVMRDRDIGAVLVTRDRSLAGIVTDRDVVVRVLADQRDPAATKLGEIASQELQAVPPTASVKEAVDMMMKRSLRRLPVVENDRPVGIVAIGDLAVERDASSALGQISGSKPNR